MIARFRITTNSMAFEGFMDSWIFEPGSRTLLASIAVAPSALRGIGVHDAEDTHRSGAFKGVLPAQKFT